MEEALIMNRNNEICEFDDYDFSRIPKKTEPITKEEEDRLIAEMKERIKKLILTEDQDRADTDAVSISVTTATDIQMIHR